MKLFNRTKVSDKTLIALLTKAGRAVGARTLRVAVQVNHSRWHCGGMAYECIASHRFGRRVETDGGIFKIQLPKIGGVIENAECFYRTALHEWGHIRDYQNGGRWKFRWSGRNGERRSKWRYRPEEVRAEEYVEKALTKRKEDYVYEEILALAIELEKQYHN